MLLTDYQTRLLNLESTLLKRRVCLKEDSVDFTEPNVTVLSITSPLPNAVIQSSNKSNHNPAIRLNVYSRNLNMSLISIANCLQNHIVDIHFDWSF